MTEISVSYVDKNNKNTKLVIDTDRDKNVTIYSYPNSSLVITYPSAPQSDSLKFNDLLLTILLLVSLVSDHTQNPDFFHTLDTILTFLLIVRVVLLVKNL
jgi:hypothetical protein